MKRVVIFFVNWRIFCFFHNDAPPKGPNQNYTIILFTKMVDDRG